MPANGRIIRNLIHGSDTVMSHITHLYHLSAADFINFEGSVVNMSPWLPSYTAADMIPGGSTLGTHLILSYVSALGIRRKMHTASALFSGRHPIQNAIVPGGVTTLYSSTIPGNATTGSYDTFGPYNSTETKSKFKSLLTDVRSFIDNKYILDVVTVANAYSAYWYVGTGCTNLLSYGDFPTDSSGSLFLKRNLVQLTTASGINQGYIREYVDYSWYEYDALAPVLLTTGKHPFDGITTPNKSTSGNAYSWLKAPRYLIGGSTITTCEVGPLARMVATALSSTQKTVTGTALVTGTYNAYQLVTTALSLCTTSTGAAPGLAHLYSPLGRHAARALEAKYLADAMALWIEELQPDQSCYTYKRIPKQISTGYGLCEAPRGALGHWIKIEGRKVAKYQCVVPSTWNFSPKLGILKTQHGAVEQSLMDTNLGSGTSFADQTRQIVTILRVVHPFDCCIACAVHVVNPEGKELMQFAIGPDGRPTNLKLSGSE
ncbi:MAG: nickel-dependent hydrogenase large subunit [Nitrospira sp.]|nr:nickel-dependent hydrogenase large subunit [Nitrospira sp.]